MLRRCPSRQTLANRLRSAVLEAIPDVVENGDVEKRYPGCVNMSFAYVEVGSGRCSSKGAGECVSGTQLI